MEQETVRSADCLPQPDGNAALLDDDDGTEITQKKR